MKYALGRKICILGPSCSGKSTLAAKIGQSLNIPVVHLDQIAHYTGTNWQRVPDALLIEKQNEFLSQNDFWVIEGNYSICMERRFSAADTVIWCDPPVMGCLYRYIKRCLKSDPDRHGNLTGATEIFNPDLVRHTLRRYPANKKKYKVFLAKNPHLKIIYLPKFSSIKAFQPYSGST